MYNTSLLIILNYTEILFCLSYTQKTALDHFCIYSNSFYCFKYSMYGLTYFAAGTAYGSHCKAPNSPPTILINTLKHRCWSRYCKSCLWKSSGQSKRPTWRLLATISQISRCEGGWAWSLVLSQSITSFCAQLGSPCTVQGVNDQGTGCAHSHNPDKQLHHNYDTSLSFLPLKVHSSCLMWSSAHLYHKYVQQIRKSHLQSFELHNAEKLCSAAF